MTALLDVVSLALPGVKLIRPTFFMDERGYFGEVFQTSRFAAAGVDTVFVQDNQIYSEKRFTLRGRHYQAPPAAQAKLVRALRGRAYVVAVMFSATVAFATPIGYQTHLMVYGPGGYKFSDFVKVGVPLDIITGIVACLTIPLFWPL